MGSSVSASNRPYEACPVTAAGTPICAERARGGRDCSQSGISTLVLGARVRITATPVKLNPIESTRIGVKELVA